MPKIWMKNLEKLQKLGKINLENPEFHAKKLLDNLYSVASIALPYPCGFIRSQMPIFTCSLLKILNPFSQGVRTLTGGTYDHLVPSVWWVFKGETSYCPWSLSGIFYI